MIYLVKGDKMNNKKDMKKSLFFLLVLIVLQNYMHGQEYDLNLNIDFSDTAQFELFEFTDHEAWRIGEDGNLELFGSSDYRNSVRSPFNIALLSNLDVGDFELKVDLKQTGREYGHRDMCLFFNFQNPTNFYYVHMATKADDHAQSIFLVNDEDRRSIATERTDGVKWDEEWHTVKIIRNAEKGEILVFFDDMKKPIMKATDHHFKYGKIGFGSFDDTGMIDNIRLKAKLPAAKGNVFD